VNRRHVYAIPTRLRLDQWALSGEWTLKAEAAVLSAAVGSIPVSCARAPPHHGAFRTPGSRSYRVFIDGQPPGASHELTETTKVTARSPSAPTVAGTRREWWASAAADSPRET